MSRHRSRRLTRARSRQILDHASAGRPGGGPLVELLRAAVPTADPDTEVGGESQALAYLRAARLVPSSEPVRAFRRTSLARVALVKVLAIVAVVTVGGIAVAAGAGVLPNPLRPHHPVQPAHTATASRSAGTGRTKPAVPPSLNPSPPSTSGSPGPSLTSLCQAWTALDEKKRSKALGTPPYRALVTAAGSPSAVPAFCADLAASGSSAGTGPAATGPGNGNGNGRTNGNGPSNGNGRTNGNGPTNAPTNSNRPSNGNGDTRSPSHPPHPSKSRGHADLPPAG